MINYKVKSITTKDLKVGQHLINFGIVAKVERSEIGAKVTFTHSVSMPAIDNDYKVFTFKEDRIFLVDVTLH